MKNFIIKRNISIICAIMLTIILNAGNAFITKNSSAIYFCAAVSTLMLALYFVYISLLDHYLSDVLSKLSAMIATLTELRDEEIFSVTEDNLLSKLQMQVMKLTGILNKQNERIASEKREIKRLISDISHQLKTPLANMQLYGSLLREAGITEEERTEYTDVIYHAVEKLSFLTESMIEMSRLESGVIQLKMVEQSLNETILQALKQIHVKSKQNNMKLSLDEQGQVEVLHDRNWLAEAIFNLLDNAVKYSVKNGTIEVQLILYEMFVCVKVKDNGIGIPESEHASIFKRFYRGQNNGEKEGIGIGLYLTRKITELHGGYMKLESNTAGSTFFIFLPMERRV